jgi:ribosomal protein L11 methyltransferase
LAIAALLLGAAKAEGVDIDPMCVRTAGENAALNGVSDRFVVEIGDLSDKASGQYDLITANIVANAIKQLAPQIPALLAPNGTFIASGIIDEREDEVAQAIRAAGLAVREIRRDNGWVCILANHPAKG